MWPVGEQHQQWVAHFVGIFLSRSSQYDTQQYDYFAGFHRWHGKTNERFEICQFTAYYTKVNFKKFCILSIIFLFWILYLLCSYSVSTIKMNQAGQFIIGASNRISFHNTLEFIKNNRDRSLTLYNKYLT